jgi:hypothetical protein
MLYFRIELGAYQYDNYRKPHPRHEPDDGAERAIGFIKVPKIGCIP